MSSKTIFYLSNPNRKKQFLIETRVLKNGANITAVKRSLSKAAVKHIRDISHSFEVLNSLPELTDLIRITPCKLNGSQEAEFEFINGETAERAAIRGLLENDLDSMIDVFDKAIAVINSLPSTNENPRSIEYRKIFGNSYEKERDCTKVGLVDLNLDNIIIDHKKNWNLIDYEWCFEFPVPRKLLVQRLFMYFIQRHQESFRFHNQKVSYVRLSDKIIAPEKLISRYKSCFTGMAELQKAEEAFQKYVSDIQSSQRKVEFYELKDTLTTIAPQKNGVQHILDGYENYKKIKPDLDKKTELLEQLKDTKKLQEIEIRKLKDSLSRIESSKSYRAASIVSRLYQKITNIGS